MPECDADGTTPFKWLLLCLFSVCARNVLYLDNAALLAVVVATVEYNTMVVAYSSFYNFVSLVE